MIAGLGSPTHLLLILVVVLLLFGAKCLPEMGRSLGQGINEFKSGLTTEDEPEEKRPEGVEGRDNAKTTQEGSQTKEATHAKDS